MPLLYSTPASVSKKCSFQAILLREFYYQFGSLPTHGGAIVHELVFHLSSAFASLIYIILTMAFIHRFLSLSDNKTTSFLYILLPGFLHSVYSDFLFTFIWSSLISLSCILLHLPRQSLPRMSISQFGMQFIMFFFRSLISCSFLAIFDIDLGNYSPLQSFRPLGLWAYVYTQHPQLSNVSIRQPVCSMYSTF